MADVDMDDARPRYAITGDACDDLIMRMEASRLPAAHPKKRRARPDEKPGGVTLCEKTGRPRTQKNLGEMGGRLAGVLGANKYLAGITADCRSKCQHKGCRVPLLPGTVRIGKKSPSYHWGHSPKTKWYHVECVFESFKACCKKSKTITCVSDIDGFEDLDAAHRERIRALVAAHAAARPDLRYAGAPRLSDEEILRRCAPAAPRRLAPIAAAPPDGALVDGDGPPDDGDVPEADGARPETDELPRAFLPPLPAFLPPLRGVTPPTPTRPPPRLPSPPASAAKPFGSPAGPSPTLPAGLRIPANLRELLTRPPTSPDDETFAFDAAAISRELYGGFAVY